jgi:cytochrome P450
MNGINFFSEAYQENPYYYYRQMQAQHPLFFDEAINSYVISLHDDVARAFKDPVFSSRNYAWQTEPVHGRTLIQMDGREHSSSRNAVGGAFRGRELLENTLPLIRQCAASLIETFKGRDVVELRDEFTNIFPIKVMVSIFGLPDKDLELFHNWYRSFQLQFENLGNNEAAFLQATAAGKEFHDYLDQVIDERTVHPGNDLLSVLCVAEIDGVKMSKSQIAGFCGLLLHAGGETTDKALANMFRNLLLHPDQLAMLRHDRRLLDRAICESLRYCPPAHMLLRITNEQVTVSGGEIPANANVVCMIGAANRDPSKFVHPDEFNILREDIDPHTTFTGASKLATFGFGRHFCIGAQLAKMEMQVAIEYLLDYMEDLQFADDKVPGEIGIFTRYPENMRVRFKAGS